MKVKNGYNSSETQSIRQCSSGFSTGTLLFLIFIKDFTNDIKSEIKVFGDDIKRLVRPLSREITQMDLNKLSY